VGSSSTSGDSWYRTWFNSPYYHLLYRNRDEREAGQFIGKLLSYLAPPKDSAFLDLACGKGRHSLRIAEEGFRVTGADLSEKNIAAAVKKETDRLRFVRHDMREALGQAQFDYVLNLFTSFGYFKSMDENERVMDAIFTELKPKGKVVIDFLNADLLSKGLVPAEEQVIDGVKFTINRSIEDGFIIKNITVDDGGKIHQFKERVMSLTKGHFTGMLNRRGFEIIDIFGNYHLDKFDPDTSGRLILIAKKP